jgi:putative tricarboxylic transport membrane protein
MLEALLLLFSSPGPMLAFLAAVPAGLMFGAVPGLGGKIALIAVMPFLFGMDPISGAVFLISMHAVVHTGAAVPTILLGIPGTGPSTAVVMDGHAMTRKGEATRAMTAAAAASAVGGVIGAIVLGLLIPASLWVLKFFSYPEIFFLALFGITFSAMLSGSALVKGLLTGCIGLALAFVGIDEIFGAPRFTFGQPFLFDGVDLIAAVLALYAIPEMIALSHRKGSEAAAAAVRTTAEDGREQVLQGLRDIVVHRWMTLRTSLIGAVVGIIPGLGGDVAAWLCYGHAAQTSRHPERFGSGAVEGIIGPEAANNSKEGGALVPTLFLGLPGSSGMAILLIALTPLGIAVGPDLAANNQQIIWVMLWALVLSNLLAAGAVILAARWLAFVSRIRPRYIVPYVYLLSLASVYMSTAEWRFFLIFVGLGLLGVVLKRQNWPRAPFVIGLILGHAAEDALVKSLSIWGPWFFLRPGSLLLMALMLFTLISLSRKLISRSKSIEGRGHAAG